MALSLPGLVSDCLRGVSAGAPLLVGEPDGPTLRMPRYSLLQSRELDEHLLPSRWAGERLARLPTYGTGQGFACQISAAYCAIVRSLENLPEPATLRIALRAHALRSVYSAQSARSAVK